MQQILLRTADTVLATIKNSPKKLEYEKAAPAPAFQPALQQLISMHANTVKQPTRSCTFLFLAANDVLERKQIRKIIGGHGALRQQYQQAQQQERAEACTSTMVNKIAIP